MNTSLVLGFFYFLFYFSANSFAGEITSNLLPDKESCGHETTDNVLRGHHGPINGFIWMALLEYEKPTGRGFHCAGSLINNRYILTAAHCVKKIPKNFTLVSVRLGEYNLETEEDCEDVHGINYCSDKPLDIPVEEVVAHEQYDPDTPKQYNDIALLRLSKEVSFSSFVGPVCLPKSSNFSSNSEGDEVLVSGWGSTHGHSKKNNVKRWFPVTVTPHSDCKSQYSKTVNMCLNEAQLCVEGRSEDASCGSDAGGPLVKLDALNWYLTGIFSFGPSPCTLQKLPNVYTRVTSYLDWIVGNLKP